MSIVNRLTKLVLENFRVFKNSTEFNFGQINILTGKNNSGKSAIIKALLFLKENNRNDLKIIRFAKLIDFNHTINNHQVSQAFKLKIEVKHTDHSNLTEEGGSEEHVQAAEFSFIAQEDGGGKLNDWIIYQDEKNITDKNEAFSFSQVSTIKTFLENIGHLPPFRNEGLVNYSIKKHEELKGLLDELEFQMQKHPVKSVGSDIVTSFQELLTSEAKDFLNKWLGIASSNNDDKGFGVMDNIDGLTIEAKGEHFSINMVRAGQVIDFSHLGSGAAQIFPILLRIALSEDDTIILEEPETNLHPSYQSMLADVIVDALSTFKETQFIIETHSEYLIRKFQYLRAKKEINELQSPIIYYLNPPGEINESTEQVIRIEIDESGNLTKEFGKGFFNEAPYLITKLWEAQRN